MGFICRPFNMDSRQPSRPTANDLLKLLQERIVIIDGAMGTNYPAI